MNTSVDLPSLLAHAYACALTVCSSIVNGIPLENVLHASPAYLSLATYTIPEICVAYMYDF